MNSAISHVVSHNSTAFISLHNQIHSEILYEEDAVVTKRTSKECVQHRVSGSVSDSAAAVSLSSFAELGRLTTEGSLINLAISSSTEWHAVRLKLANSNWSFSCHVLDCILVTEPIATFDSVVEVVSPVIFVHVSKSCVNATLTMFRINSYLCCYSVGPCREQL